MTFTTAFYTTIVGAAIGLVWSLALNFQLTSGLLYGGIVGLILGISLSFLNKAILNRGNVQKGEAGAVTGSLLGLLFLVGVAAGLIAWLIRFIFF